MVSYWLNLLAKLSSSYILITMNMYQSKRKSIELILNKENAKQYRFDNKDKMKQHRFDHEENAKQYQIKYRLQNRDKVNQQQKKYRAKKKLEK
jgi:hypothetical protein